MKYGGLYRLATTFRLTEFLQKVRSDGAYGCQLSGSPKSLAYQCMEENRDFIMGTCTYLFPTLSTVYSRSGGVYIKNFSRQKKGLVKSASGTEPVAATVHK